MRKKAIALCCLATMFATLTASTIFTSQDYNKNKELSMFVGTWDWMENSPEEHSFYVWVGERNDSLLFCIGGIFYGGEKIQMPERDCNSKRIPIVKIPIPKERIAKSKISEALSNFYFDQGKMKVYNDVSFELKNDSTLLFILDDNKGYWPDTAFMKRRDRFNDQFSYEENELMYRE